MGACWSTTREGPPGAARVVLVHGSLDRSTSFARVDRALDDLTVVRYDRRGYGRSLELGPAESFEQQLDDLGAVVGAPAVVAGHSYGGVLAVALAERRPDLVRAVVAYEAPMPWTAWWPRTSAGGQAMAAGDTDPAAAAERFMRRMVGDDRWTRLPPATRAQRRAEGAALLAELAHLRTSRHAPYDPARITVPVVTGSGSGSAAHHRRAPRTLAAAVVTGEHHEVEGASHGVHLTHPAAFAGLVRRSLELAAG